MKKVLPACEGPASIAQKGKRILNAMLLLTQHTEFAEPCRGVMYKFEMRGNNGGEGGGGGGGGN